MASPIRQKALDENTKLHKYLPCGFCNGGTGDGGCARAGGGRRGGRGGGGGRKGEGVSFPAKFRDLFFCVCENVSLLELIISPRRLQIEVKHEGNQLVIARTASCPPIRPPHIVYRAHTASRPSLLLSVIPHTAVRPSVLITLVIAHTAVRTLSFDRLSGTESAAHRLVGRSCGDWSFGGGHRRDFCLGGVRLGVTSLVRLLLLLVLLIVLLIV